MSTQQVVLSPKEARRRLVNWLGLARSQGRGRRGVLSVLARLRCIQLDPLDVIGTNADLVVMARVDGIGRGELWQHLFPNHAFEHFAKERCILPASAFPWYRDRGHAAQAPWWRHHEREQRIDRRITAALLAEIADHEGPVSTEDLTDHGGIEPIDWSGWKGTARATSMALEILWTRCDIVVCGRTARGSKLYDLPQRALGPVAKEKPEGDFDRWAIAERVRAAGLLSRAGGSNWSMLGQARLSPVPDVMVQRGELVDVRIDGSPRRYLATPEFLHSPLSRDDGRVRILGPLDPLLWDRSLVRHAFEFDYVWEVYKPAHLRKWGWYVCPLLEHDRLIGRIDARISDGLLAVRKLWLERDTDRNAVRLALERHAEAYRCRDVKLSAQARRSLDPVRA
ncbi:MAG: winged helix DNA-binding domain-containing protein [Acidobacteriota bacterium]